MKQDKIINLVAELSSKLQKKNGEIPKCDWGGSYIECCELQESVSVHAQLKKFPEKMMKSRAPNESDAEMNYRKDNFEPITMPYWYRASSSVSGRIWSEQNYRINISNEDAETYFLHEYPIYNSILQYFRTVVTNYKIADPNALLCVSVDDLPMKDNGSGEMIVDDSEAIEPTLQIYGCNTVLAFEIDEYALVLSGEKTKVEFANQAKKEGLKFYLYDTETIYAINQVGKKTEWKFEVVPVYEHNLGYLPAWKLRGIPKIDIKDDDSIIYYSYFMPAVPLLNKALKQDSTLDASISKIAYPTRVYYEDECDNTQCVNGKVAIEHGEGGAVIKWGTCPTCNGTGKGGLKFSPLRDYVQRPPKKNLTEEEKDMPFPAFAYVSPDSAILTFTKDKIKEEIEQAFTFINIDVSLKSGSAGNTATESKIDREELFSFLLHFSSECYELLEKSMNTLYEIRYNESAEDIITISAPKTFEIYTADELTYELAEAKKSGVPEVAVRELSKEYMAQRFSQQGKLPKIVDIVFAVDAYATKETTDIAILKSNNLISSWEAILHEHIYQFIEELISEDETFLDKPLKEQKIILQGMAKAKANELQPNSAENIIANLGGGAS